MDKSTMKRVVMQKGLHREKRVLCKRGRRNKPQHFIAIVLHNRLDVLNLASE